MVCQFIHQNAYALKSSKTGKRPNLNRGGKAKSGTPKMNLRRILLEVERNPSDCRHVAAPLPPVRLRGMGALEFYEFVKGQVTDGARSASGRVPFRKDFCSAVVGVCAYPIPAKRLRADSELMQAYEAWEADALAFLEKEFGENFRGASRHEDEPYLHFHYMLAEERRADGRLGVHDVHPGHKARAEAKRDGDKVTAQNKAFVAVMESFQDRFYEEVSKKHGHDRTGPKRPRKSRIGHVLSRKRQDEFDRLAKKVKRILKQVERALSMRQAEVAVLIQSYVEKEVSFKEKVALKKEIERKTAAYEDMAAACRKHAERIQELAADKERARTVQDEEDYLAAVIELQGEMDGLIGWDGSEGPKEYDPEDAEEEEADEQEDFDAWAGFSLAEA